MGSAEDRRRAHALTAEGARARGRGDRLGAERSYREALSLFALLEDLHSSARMLAELADLRLLAGDYRAAADLRRQAVERDHGGVDTLTGLGFAQWLGGSPADAEVTLGQALSRDRRAVRALAARGQIRTDLGDYGAALRDLDDAIALGLAPQDESGVRSARALSLAGIGRTEEGRAAMAAELERSPDRPATRIRAARLALLADQPDEARHHLQAIGSLDATEPETHAARRLLSRLQPSS